MKHTVLNKGVFHKIDKLDSYHIEFPWSFDFFSMPSNMIPWISGVSGGRVLLGAKSTLQSIPLVHRERALVESVANDQNQSTQEMFGKHYLSVTASEPGTIVDVTENDVKVKTKDGKIKNYDIYKNYNLGAKESKLLNPERLHDVFDLYL